MNRKGAILKFALIGIIFISVVLIGGVAYLYQIEITKNKKLQAQVDELTARERVTEGKLEDSKKKVSELMLKFQETKGRITAITEELDKEKSMRQEASKELEQIKADMEQQNFSRQDIENKLTQAQNDGRKLKEQLRVITQQKTELEVKIRNLESSASGVELGKVVVNSEVSDPPKEKNRVAEKNINIPVPELEKEKKGDSSQVKPLEGKVTVVNKEYNFAVINLGQKDGINIEDQFSVYREGKVVGDLKVEKVHESMSAAGFVAELKDVIKENDLVVQKAK
ncbi:MAG: hypothetical protein KJ710_06100 [Candidatus Omnitrophica bacterium]|nr:hypothetical protein [Candidatus Omnitrophota bacterium]MBU1923807.1 hypothetical protein [Candidatus Omnitrophota bacterium]